LEMCRQYILNKKVLAIEFHKDIEHLACM
jgi:hypothetical protein